MNSYLRATLISNIKLLLLLPLLANERNPRETRKKECKKQFKSIVNTIKILIRY